MGSWPASRMSGEKRCVHVQVPGSLLLLISIPQAITLLNRSPKQVSFHRRVLLQYPLPICSCLGQYAGKNRNAFLVQNKYTFSPFRKETIGSDLERFPQLCEERQMCALSLIQMLPYTVALIVLPPPVNPAKRLLCYTLNLIHFFHQQLIWHNDTL